LRISFIKRASKQLILGAFLNIFRLGVIPKHLAASFRDNELIATELKIGIHNIIPTIAYILYTAACIFLTIFLLNKFDGETPGTIMLYTLLILGSYGMFGLLSFRLKFVFLTDKKFTVLRPFRFQLRTIDFNNIKKIDWNIWSIHRLGDYRNLTITTNDFKTNFTDFEFINFNALESFLLEKTKGTSKFNLTNKQNVELSQAKENRWWNIVAVLMSIFFLAMISLNGKTGAGKLIAQIIITFLIIRMIVVFVEYQNRISDFNKKRRKR
jgi:uncharacterized membrane protein